MATVCNTASSAQGVAGAGGYAYVANGYGLEVVDVSDPTSPEVVGHYDPLGYGLKVAVAGDYAYLAVASGFPGLMNWWTFDVVDVSDPTIPYAVGYGGTPGQAVDVAVAGDYAYVACLDGGFVVLRTGLFVEPWPQIYLPVVCQRD